MKGKRKDDDLSCSAGEMKLSATAPKNAVSIAYDRKRKGENQDERCVY